MSRHKANRRPSLFGWSKPRHRKGQPTKPRCSARLFTPRGWSEFCSRSKGHDGNHIVYADKSLWAAMARLDARIQAENGWLS